MQLPFPSHYSGHCTCFDQRILNSVDSAVMVSMFLAPSNFPFFVQFNSGLGKLLLYKFISLVEPSLTDFSRRKLIQENLLFLKKKPIANVKIEPYPLPSFPFDRLPQSISPKLSPAVKVKVSAMIILIRKIDSTR